MQWGICAMTFQPGLGSQLQKRRSGLWSFFCDSVRQVVVFLSLRSCQYVMRASIGQVSSPIIMSLVDSLMRTMSGLIFESKLRSVCRKSCRFSSRSAILSFWLVSNVPTLSPLWSVKLCHASMRFGWMNFRFFPRPRRNVPECVQGFPSLSCKAYRCRQSHVFR